MKTRNLFIIIVTIFCLFNCSELLEEKPKSLSVEVFYNTPAEVEAAVNAIYNPLRDPNCMGVLYPGQHEAMPDYGNGRGSYTIISDYTGLDNTNITRVGQIWDLMYQSIRNANLVIQNAPNGGEITPEAAARYVAEAKFMRAFIYFIMVRNWGGVPLRTELNMTEAAIERSSTDEIYVMIVEDLLEAEQNLPDAAAQPGRPTTWAAKTVLADVYLNLEEFAMARDKAKEVIDAAKYSLVPVSVSEDFQKIFGPEVVTTPEEIFYLKYSRQQGFTMVMMAHIAAAKYHGAGGYFAHYSDSEANPFIKGWAINDLRKSYNLYKWDIGLGPNSVLNRKFRDPAATNANGAGNDYPLYRYADLLLLHAEAESRANNGPTVQAMESLNMVHRRAYGLDPVAPSAIDFDMADYNVDSFLDLVFQERGYETMYEGKRWLELKRLGRAKSVILEVKGKTVADKMLLWPIPLSELSYNTALDPVADQNPGY
jgi:hypothetical protein